MILVSRLLVGLIGLASLLAVWSHWFDIAMLAPERGIHAVDDIGRANIRADVGGLFLCIASFALIAAWQCSRTWLIVVFALVGSALLGRFVSVAIDGFSARVGTPMLVEAIVIAVLGVAYWSWGKKPEGL
jgi:hypothetical protein